MRLFFFLSILVVSFYQARLEAAMNSLACAAIFSKKNLSHQAQTFLPYILEAYNKNTSYPKTIDTLKNELASLESRADLYFEAAQVLNPNLEKKQYLGMLLLRYVGSHSTHIVLRGQSKYDTTENVIFLRLNSRSGGAEFQPLLVVELGIENIIKVSEAHQIILEIKEQARVRGLKKDLSIFSNDIVNAFSESSQPGTLKTYTYKRGEEKNHNKMVIRDHTSMIFISLDGLNSNEAAILADIIKRVVNKEIMRTLPVVVI